MAVSTLSIVAGLIALVVGGIYLFGIPSGVKRAMEDKALETMGENKMSYMLKDQISKVPASDQAEVQEVQKGVGNAAGGLTQNPLGKEVGELGDKLTSPLTGR